MDPNAKKKLIRCRHCGSLRDRRVLRLIDQKQSTSIQNEAGQTLGTGPAQQQNPQGPTTAQNPAPSQNTTAAPTGAPGAKHALVGAGSVVGALRNVRF